MRVKAFDRIEGAVTSGRSPFPAPIMRILAQAKLDAPPAGATIPLATVDAALAGLSIERRLEIKAALRAANMIA